MKWYYLASGIIVFLIIALLLLKITVQITFSHESKHDHLYVRLSIFKGIVHYTYQIPLIAIDDESPSIVIKEKKSMQESENKRKITPEEVMQSIKQWQCYVKKIVNLQAIIREFLHHISIRKFCWKSEVGVFDAMQTGMATGALWGIKGQITGFLSVCCRLQTKPELQVIPFFQQTRLKMNMECIFVFRLGHAIKAVIKTIKRLKGRRQSCQNIQSKV